MEKCKDKLRLALVGSYPSDHTQIRGGVQAAFSSLVSGLSRITGVEVHVLTFMPPNWYGPDHSTQNGVTTHLLPRHPRFERLIKYRRYQSILDQKLEQIQPDVVHAQEAAANAYVAIRSGYPTVVTAHGIRSEDTKYISSWSRRLRFRFDSVIIERAVIRQTRHLIAISHYIPEYFKTLLRLDLEVYYVPNAIGERFFNLTDIVSEQVVLFAGRVTPLKRVMDLVQAFAQIVKEIPSAQLHIAGECNSEASYVESIRCWIRQAGVEEHIHILGELQEEALLREYAQCSMIALSSSQENAPMVIAQAMAAGKPVVATRVGGVAEMIGETGERGLLVKVGDVDGLAQAMLRLLQDPVLQAQLGQAGHTFARENYHQDRVARRTYEVYRHIAAIERGVNA